MGEGRNFSRIARMNGDDLGQPGKAAEAAAQPKDACARQGALGLRQVGVRRPSAALCGDGLFEAFIRRG